MSALQVIIINGFYFLRARIFIHTIFSSICIDFYISYRTVIFLWFLRYFCKIPASCLLWIIQSSSKKSNKPNKLSSAGGHFFDFETEILRKILRFQFVRIKQITEFVCGKIAQIIIVDTDKISSKETVRRKSMILLSLWWAIWHVQWTLEI